MEREKTEQERKTMLELNFCEFPISSLKTQKNFKPLYFEDTIADPETGAQIHRNWIVDGSLIVGTPVSEDKKVLQAVIHLMNKEKCFELNFNHLHRTMYTLLKLLTWPVDGPHYEMLKDSLIRLVCCRIHAKQSFWDNKERRLLVDEIFGIFDELKIYGKKTGKPEIDSYLWDEPYLKIVLSKRLFESLQSGYTNTVPLDFYLSLDNPTTQRLYEVLVKKLHKTGKYWFDVKTLCCEYLGMSRNLEFKELKRALNDANENLLKRGFIKSYLYPKQHKGKRIDYKISESMIDEKRASAIKLAGWVRREFWNRDSSFLSYKEIEHMHKLISKSGYDRAKQIMTLIMQWAKEDGFKPTWIGGLLSGYSEKAEKHFENIDKNSRIEEEKRNRKVTEKKRIEEEDKRKASLLKEFKNLNPKERAKLETEAVELSKSLHGKRWNTELSMNYARMEVMENIKRKRRILNHYENFPRLKPQI